MNPAQADNTRSVFVRGVAIVLLLALVLVAALFATLFGPWLRGLLSGVPVSMARLLGMRIRGVPPRLIVDAIVTLVHRGYPINRDLWYHTESLYLAQRGLIQSPEQLADLMERQLKMQPMP